MPPELTATQLHELMQPLWERKLGLRPERLELKPAFPEASFARLQEVHWIFDGRFMGTQVATQLCESQMVRWLAAHDHVKIFGGVGGWDVQGWSEWFTAPTLVQALAAACTAVLDAKAEEPG